MHLSPAANRENLERLKCYDVLLTSRYHLVKDALTCENIENYAR